MSESKSSGKRFCLNASDCIEIQMGDDPKTSGMKPETMWDVLRRTVSQRGNELAYRACTQTVKDADAGLYFTSSSDQDYTWSKFYNMSMEFAQALVKCGFTPYAACNMIGFNSPEWVIADLGCMMAQGLAAGIYATNNAEACQYVSAHSKAEFILCEGQKQLDKFIEVLTNKVEGGIPTLKALIVYNMDPAKVNAQKDAVKALGVDLYEFAEFIAMGRDDADGALKGQVEERMAAQKPGNCCMLIYTSGTTGNPKAVMISHDNATWTAKMLSKHIDGLLPSDRVISYLPLSHIAAQILDVVSPMLVGLTVTFARPDALKGTLPQTLAAVRPTIFFGVPRVWEKIMAKIKAAGAATKGLKKSIASWAKGIGMDFSLAKQGMSSPGQPNFKTAASPCGYSCADCLVLSKVKNLLGLTEARVMITGAAPISKETLDFYAALDLPIMEVYGQSECTGPATCTSPMVGWKTGTVGPVLPGTTMRIDPNTQEIQYTGRHIFMGYMGMKEKTEGTLTDDGWLASGDQGAFDEDQFLSITGRIKELIIGAGGENVAPVVVEKVLKKHLPGLSNIVVFGDNKPYLGMLVSLEVVPDATTELPTDQLAPGAIAWCKSIGSDCTTYSAAKTDDKINAAIDAGRKAAIASKDKGIISNASQPKFHIWLPEELTPHGETATLTSTLKLKRNVVNKMYADTIEQGYKEQTAKFAKKK